VLGLALLYADFASNPILHAAVTGVGAAGAGLFIATAGKLGRPLARRPAALAMIAACFLAVAIGACRSSSSCRLRPLPECFYPREIFL